MQYWKRPCYIMHTESTNLSLLYKHIVVLIKTLILPNNFAKKLDLIFVKSSIMPTKLVKIKIIPCYLIFFRIINNIVLVVNV